MSSSARLKELAGRKRLLVAQSDLHRELIGMEAVRLRERRDAAQDFGHRHRWWLHGGLALGSVLLAGKFRGLSRWLPAATILLRALKG